jgi:hypothetical protein
VAVIKVGGSSEVEVGEKEDRSNAQNGTCAVVGEGILPECGIALLKASFTLSTISPRTSNLLTNPDAKPVPTANCDQDRGMSRALTHPTRTILNNAGEEASITAGNLLTQYSASNKFAWGYNAQNGEYLDMIQAGIVNPLNVVRTAGGCFGGSAGVPPPPQWWWQHLHHHSGTAGTPPPPQQCSGDTTATTTQWRQHHHHYNGCNGSSGGTTTTTTKQSLPLYSMQGC